MKNQVQGRFIRRYKRFLVDVKLEDGTIVIAHCTNSGSLKSCLIPNAPVILTPVNNPNRKTQFTWEMIKAPDSWIGVNTNMANVIAYELLKQRKIKDFSEITEIKREVKFGNSRIDLMVKTPQKTVLIEVKNVTYRKGKYALFPDAPTKRGQKHLLELMRAQETGMAAAMFFIIQRTDTEIFAPAWDIDPQYSRLLLQAYQNGVAIYPIQIRINPHGWQLERILPFDLRK